MTAVLPPRPATSARGRRAPSTATWPRRGSRPSDRRTGSTSPSRCPKPTSRARPAGRPRRRRAATPSPARSPSSPTARRSGRCRGAAVDRRAHHPVALPDPPAGREELRIEVGDVDPVTPVPGDPSPAEILPVAIAEVQGDGPAARRSTRPRSTAGAVRCSRWTARRCGCEPTGETADARAGLALEPCDGPLELAAGRHTIASGRAASTWGSTSTGWCSARPPTARRRPSAPRGTPRSEAGATVEVAVRPSGQRLRPRPRAATARRSGWCWGRATIEGGTSTSTAPPSGPREIVDGYANGWLITPDGPGELTASLRWGHSAWCGSPSSSPRWRWLACLVILVRTRRRPVDDGARGRAAHAGRLAGWPPRPHARGAGAGRGRGDGRAPRGHPDGGRGGQRGPGGRAPGARAPPGCGRGWRRCWCWRRGAWSAPSWPGWRWPSWPPTWWWRGGPPGPSGDGADDRIDEQLRHAEGVLPLGLRPRRPGAPAEPRCPGARSSTSPSVTRT